MGRVIGQSNYLPGRILPLTNLEVCDRCGKPATAELVGETDSMGSETEYLCPSCLQTIQQAIDAQRTESCHCDLCHTDQTTCRPFRDPEEGCDGPVYMACAACRERVVRDLEDLIQPSPFEEIDDPENTVEPDEFDLEPNITLMDELDLEDPSNRDEDEKDLTLSEQVSD